MSLFNQLSGCRQMFAFCSIVGVKSKFFKLISILCLFKVSTCLAYLFRVHYMIPEGFIYLSFCE